MSHPLYVHLGRRYQDLAPSPERAIADFLETLNCLPPLAQVRRKRGRTLSPMPSMRTSPSPMTRDLHSVRQFDLPSWFVLIVTNPICPIQEPPPTRHEDVRHGTL